MMKYLYSYLKIVVTLVLTYFLFSSITLAQNHFEPIWTAPYLPMNFYVTGADLASGGGLLAGDEIGIFDGINCVGSFVLSAPIDPLDPIQIIASTDDPGSTELDGFIPGNPVTYKFWISTTSTEYDQYIVEYALGNGLFVSQGDALVSFTSILPVELNMFAARCNGNQVSLKWETKTEVNNFGFEIERCLPSPDEYWEKIGFVEGNGNSNSPKFYSYTDENVLSGYKYLYRLKQIDTDGSYEYSSVIEVEVTTPSEFELNQNYPNPFNPKTIISFTLAKKEFIELNIFNELGEKVEQLVKKHLPPGYYHFFFSGENFPSGVYLYRIQVGDIIQSKKMVLVK